MITKTSILYSLLGTLLILSGLFAYSFTGANWNSAPANPPTGNTEPPIDTSGVEQVKAGNFGANVLAADEAVWSDQYCDGAGENCVNQNDLLPGGGSGNEIVWLDSRDPITQTVTALIPRGYPSNIARAFMYTVGQDVIQGPGDRYSPNKMWFTQNIAGLTVKTPLYDSPSAGVISTWITLDKPIIQTETSRGGGPVSTSIVAYECYGTCLEAPRIPTCRVDFSWNIKGKTGTLTKRLPKYQNNYLIADYSQRPGNRHNNLSQNYDLYIAGHSWSRGLVGLQIGPHNATIGVMNPYVFDIYKTLINNSANSNSRALRMVPGTTATVRNLNPPLSAGDVVLTANVVNCQN